MNPKLKPFDVAEAYHRQYKGDNCVEWNAEPEAIYYLVHTNSDRAWIRNKDHDGIVPISELALTVPMIKREAWVGIGKNSCDDLISLVARSKDQAELLIKQFGRTLVAVEKIAWEEPNENR